MDNQDAQELLRVESRAEAPASRRWPTLLKVAVSASLVLVLFLVLRVPAKGVSSRSLDFISESSELQIDGAKGKDKDMVEQMQKGFAAMSDMFGLGDKKKTKSFKGFKGNPLEAAKESMQKAEAAMMKTFKDLQKKGPKMQSKNFMSPSHSSERRIKRTHVVVSSEVRGSVKSCGRLCSFWD
ncbi:unnamed protein product [Effrenium voratum]|nr:unnamed protein product [Effrenium voratum]CAJ1421187.1 unnamed protein product [Effrenium voratum]